jgi:hypothetical protein
MSGPVTRSRSQFTSNPNDSENQDLSDDQDSNKDTLGDTKTPLNVNDDGIITPAISPGTYLSSRRQTLGNADETNHRNELQPQGSYTNRATAKQRITPTIDVRALPKYDGSEEMFSEWRFSIRMTLEALGILDVVDGRRQIDTFDDHQDDTAARFYISSTLTGEVRTLVVNSNATTAKQMYDITVAYSRMRGAEA